MMDRSASFPVFIVLSVCSISCHALDFESHLSHTTISSASTTTVGQLVDEATTKEQTNQTNVSMSTAETLFKDTDTSDVPSATTISETITSDYDTTTNFSSPRTLSTTTVHQSLEVMNNNTIVSNIFHANNSSQVDTCSLACQNGARCATDGTDHWCRCSWAFSGRYCENVLPLYLALSLIGGGVILLFLFGLSILLCIKLAISKRVHVQTKAIDRTSFTDTFHKPEPGAVYVDPAVYYGTLCRTTLTPSRLSSGGRPRLNLESFENSHHQQQQQINGDEQAIISSSRTSYSPPGHNNSEVYHSPHKNRKNCSETRIDDESSTPPIHALNA